MTSASTLPALLDARLRADAASPLVTFYDDATGERVEVSAVTFANWVAKSANLLIDGFGVGPGDVAHISLPLHWQALVVTAACWAAGLTVDLDGAMPNPAVAFVAEGASDGVDAVDVVALSLRPMGGRLLAADPNVTDYAAEVLAHGDRFPGASLSPTDLAVPGHTHEDLLSTAHAVASSSRGLIAPAGDPALDLALVTAAYLAPLAGGGSIVLSRHSDQQALPRRLESERATLLS